MRRTPPMLLAWCIGAASMLAWGRAEAEPTPEEKALATALFREAKTLIDAGQIPQACRKLEESQRLDPGGGTLLNLAVCHEKEGKTATAWAEFRDARLIADRDGRDDRTALADDRLKALERKLSKLVIRVSAEADAQGIEITLDAYSVRRPAWGTAAPVDPGDHVVEARAPGKKVSRVEVKVLPDGDMKTITIGPLEDDAPASVAAPIASAEPPPSPSSPPPRDRTAAIIAASIGLSGVAVGSYFGLRAISKHQESRDACTSTPCGSTAIELNDSAKTAADVSTVAFAVGAVGLGVATYLWFFTGGSGGPSTRRVRVLPMSVRCAF